MLPVERRPLAPSTAAMFSAELEAPVLAADELYGSKLVAAMDRQHPRDLFDAWEMFAHGGLTDGAVECFVTLPVEQLSLDANLLIFLDASREYGSGLHASELLDRATRRDPREEVAALAAATAERERRIRMYASVFSSPGSQPENHGG